MRTLASFLFVAATAMTCTAQIICVPGSAAVGPWTVDEDPGPPEPLTNDQVISPWTHYNYARSRHQYLFLASELDLILNPDLTAGLCPGEPIDSISFWVNSNVFLANQKAYAWRMLIKHTATTSLTSFDNTVDPAATCALSNDSLNGTAALNDGSPHNQPALGGAGWRSFHFSPPFIWNGVDNLIIDLCYATTTTNVAQPTIWCSTVLPFNGSYSRYGAASGTCVTNGACGAVNIAGCGMDNACGSGGANNQRPVVLFSGIVSTYATGIAQNDLAGVIVHHDPDGGQLHIEANGYARHLDYVMHDAQGRSLEVGRIARSTSLDLRSLADGLYTFTLTDGISQRVERFVVSR